MFSRLSCAQGCGATADFVSIAAKIKRMLCVPAITIKIPEKDAHREASEQTFTIVSAEIVRGFLANVWISRKSASIFYITIRNAKIN
jgi:hypothetical protein